MEVVTEQAILNLLEEAAQVGVLPVLPKFKALWAKEPAKNRKSRKEPAMILEGLLNERADEFGEVDEDTKSDALIRQLREFEAVTAFCILTNLQWLVQAADRRFRNAKDYADQKELPVNLVHPQQLIEGIGH